MIKIVSPSLRGNGVNPGWVRNSGAGRVQSLSQDGFLGVRRKELSLRLTPRARRRSDLEGQLR